MPATWAKLFTFQQSLCPSIFFISDSHAVPKPRRKPGKAKNLVNERITRRFSYMPVKFLTENLSSSYRKSRKDSSTTKRRFFFIPSLTAASISSFFIRLPVGLLGFPRIITASSPAASAIRIKLLLKLSCCVYT